MRTTYCNIYKLCGFPTQCCYVFLMILQTDNDNITKHHWMIVRYNGAGFCYGWGENGIVVCYVR